MLPRIADGMEGDSEVPLFQSSDPSKETNQPAVIPGPCVSWGCRQLEITVRCKRGYPFAGRGQSSPFPITGTPISEGNLLRPYIPARGGLRIPQLLRPVSSVFSLASGFAVHAYFQYIPMASSDYIALSTQSVGVGPGMYHVPDRPLLGFRA